VIPQPELFGQGSTAEPSIDIGLLDLCSHLRVPEALPDVSQVLIYAGHSNHRLCQLQVLLPDLFQNGERFLVLGILGIEDVGLAELFLDVKGDDLLVLSSTVGARLACLPIGEVFREQVLALEAKPH
jgi:hypothetical protein